MAYLMRTFVLLTFAITILFTTDTAQAQSNEEKLKSIFSEMIDIQKATTNMEDGDTLIFDGDVVVEPIEDYFAVTLPHIKVEHEDGEVFDIGIISINASPHTKDGQWKMSVAIPSQITHRDAAGEHIMRMNIGTQQTAGIWDEGLNNFSKLEAAYGDITIESSDPQLSMSVPSMEIRHDFEEDKNGLWSGPYLITAKDLSLNVKEDKTKVKLDELKARFDLDRYDAARTKQFKETMMSLANTSTALSEEEVKALTNTAIDAVLNSGNGFTSNYSATGLNVHHTDKFGDTNVANLDNARIGFDLLGFLDKNVSIGLRMGYNNFKLDGQIDAYEGFDPTNAHIDLKLENLPIKDITELSRNTISNIVSAPEASAMMGLSLILKLPVLLSQAKTTLKIKDNFISSNEYKITLDGDVIADMNAANSATAKAQAKFFGLDKILAKAQLLSDDPDNKNAGRFREIKRKLSLLKSIGKIETGEDNQFIHVFDIIMNPQGQILVNDQDYRTIGTTPAPSIEEISNP